MLESDKCLYLSFGIPRSGVIENSRRIIELLRIRALVRAARALPVLLAACPQSFAEPAPAIHYAPAENLERIDVALIDKAAQEIDMAAYVLTDWPVLQALTRAADRGVKVRIYLDGVQLAERSPATLRSRRAWRFNTAARLTCFAGP
jgi:phosphatidylserine/phosphatidylglycerophosphate/cardiolipin synthase-like enzyme